MKSTTYEIIKKLAAALQEENCGNDFILKLHNEESCYFGTPDKLERVILKVPATNVPVKEYPCATIWTDGSYNVRTKVVGYAAVIDLGNEKQICTGKSDNPDHAAMRNVAGEILAVLEAMKFAQLHNIKEIVICYDYLGVEKWVTGEWKVKKPFTKTYRDIMRGLIDKGYVIRFRKILAHSGVTLNDEADKLAKAACGVN